MVKNHKKIKLNKHNYKMIQFWANLNNYKFKVKKQILFDSVFTKI